MIKLFIPRYFKNGNFKKTFKLYFNQFYQRINLRNNFIKIKKKKRKEQNHLLETQNLNSMFYEFNYIKGCIKSVKINLKINEEHYEGL